jgi:ribosomal protein S18 acetylase RimI-like enzyme
MIELVPMAANAFEDYLAYAVPHYADELVRAGNAHPGDALATAEAQFQSLLPEGLSTPGQHLYAIHDRTLGARVGYLWFGIREPDAQRYAALYDFSIAEEYRRQGYATQALHVLEEKVRALDLDEIRLHVFGHNQPARALYQKMGYLETNVTMAKVIGP